METASSWPDEPPWLARYRRARRRRHPSLFLPLLIAAIQVTGCLAASRGSPPGAGLDAFAYALLVGGPTALIWRRSHPVVAFGLVQAATVGYLVLGYPRGPFFLAGVVALFGAIRRGHRLAAWLIVAGGYAVYVLATTVPGTLAGRPLARATLGEYVVVAAWTAVVLAVAELSRIRSAHFAEVARSRAEAARARQEQARRQASDERLRIAQELHDVLGHHLSLINVRAGVALHLLDSKPEQAREALSAIKVASSEALREVRSVLATLNAGGLAPPRSPAPGLADVNRLAKDSQDGGITVHIERSGDVRTIPGEVDRAAYRIVQEALTNVRRHAGPAASVTVGLEYGRSELTVRVEDTGAGRPPSTTDTGAASDTGAAPGNGIPGMRERAAALGGTLTAEPRPGGGFRVEARLPLPGNAGTSRSTPRPAAGAARLTEEYP